MEKEKNVAKQKPVVLKIVFISEKEEKSFRLDEVLLGRVLFYAATISPKYNFSIKIYEDDKEIEEAIITTKNSEEIRNLKVFLRNYREKNIALKNKLEYAFSLI